MSEEWEPVEHVLPPNTSGAAGQSNDPTSGAGGWQTVPSGPAYGGVVPPQTSSYQTAGYSQGVSVPLYGAPPQAKKSHLARNIVLIVLGFVALGMVGCGAIVYKGLTMLRDSRPTQLAVQTAEKNALVQQRIGSPLTPSMWVSGSVHTSLDGGVKAGSAHLKIRVKGPKGDGSLLADEAFGAEGWKVLSLTYTDGSGSSQLVRDGIPEQSRDTF